MLRVLWYRFYSDFLLPDRLGEYRRLLNDAVALGYELHSISSYRRARQAVAPGDAKWLILRHDVDTDVQTARMLFEIECKLGATASYFFRLSTVDTEFMCLIEARGGEASYHFEELATVAKQRRLHTQQEVAAHLPEIRDRFRENLTALRLRTGLPMRIIAAHGDMANRHLGLGNYELLSDELRAELDIDAEMHDHGITPGHLRFSDDSYPRHWKPYAPRVALERGESVVYLLTHPRHWRRNVRENLKDDLQRLWAGARYREWSKLSARR